ncbi:GTP-binding protein [Anaerobranca californiensis DSM 14826]|jgi:GTP-binding protein|uniref:GTPase Der n=1 Tax=Anaerobranca californiensis DSM 14826 TaxID=1120989 RepID=A0A1M6N797_9FIRM|nr:ribosome biogenesis GTPase Der [Anaerobranca californiensis]SHJ91579.1 GTP-binding protein [Anaerobranca californiensis DSM 14826]
MALPIVAIVGRPNVGKSTLFNRIIGQRLAIVEDQPGATRDRLYSKGEWLNKEFMLIDTGGMTFDERDVLAASVTKQAQLAVDESDVIIFTVDGRTGITTEDMQITEILRKTQKPVIVAVNKIEEFKKQEGDFYEFYSLGFEEMVAISAANGFGIGDLLDKVIENFTEEGEDKEGDALKITFIGRPNVGKSSLVNKLLGSERVIVSDIPGTTRDAIDTKLEVEGETFILVDTAGLRRKSKVEESIEYYSVLRTIKAIERSDVAILVIDATTGVTEQDKRIAGFAHEGGKGVIIMVNKWDLIEKDNYTVKEFTREIRRELSFMDYAPIIFVSALTGQRINKIIPLVKEVAEQNALRIPTSLVNDVIFESIAITPPPTDRGKQLKINYVSQVSTKPPTFVFFVNDKELMHFSYLRFLENQLRNAFGFQGTPIRLIVRNKNEE